MKYLIILTLLFSFTAEARQHRSYHAIKEFKLEHPALLTAITKGRCTGYIIDHVKALACGGLDSPKNMQWQTVDDAKAKDRWERAGC